MTVDGPSPGPLGPGLFRGQDLSAVLGGAPRDAADALDRAGRHPGEPVGGGPRARKKTFPVPAALGSPTARWLPALLARDGHAEEAAALIEAAGGRTAARAEARAHTAAARELTEPLDSLVGRAPWP
ncbi:hypothetical protein [Streptomyces sp. NRRL F-3307]|uniref:hypothetical protein n=1 Tax=Streptomyces TaxID=1883 RepID=UPI003B637BAC